MRYLTHSTRTILILISTALFSELFAQKPIETVPDADIEQAIEQLIAEDEMMSGNEVDVLTNQGIVTLTGWVFHLLAEDRAVALASTVKGVRSVINRIMAMPVFETETDIQRNIKGALAVHPATEAAEIDVHVNQSVVTLRCMVKDFLAKTAAEENAKNTVGVVEVDNHLVVKPFSNPTEDRIRDNIKEALLWDPLVEAYQLSVLVSDGQVVLKGEVESYLEKRHVTWVAARVNGVVDVHNDIAYHPNQ